MQHSMQLVIRPGFGVATFPAMCYDLVAEAAWKRAVQQGLVVGMERISFKDDSKTEAAVRLTHTSQFPSGGVNSVTAWNVQVGGNYLTNPTDSLGYGTCLAWEDYNPNDIAMISSTGFQIDANGFWNICLFIPKPTKAQLIKVFQIRFGGYQIQIDNGKFYGMWITNQWTQDVEDTINAYQAQSSLTSDEQDYINTNLPLIYQDYKHIDLGSSELFYNQPFILTFMPEACGRANIILEGKRERSHENTLITGSRQDGILWNAGPVTLRTYGGGFIWQVGNPLFALAGSLRYNFSTYPYDASTLPFAESNPAGQITSFGAQISITQGALNYFTEQLTLSVTSDGTYTPFIYALQLLIDPVIGTRPTTTLWDSSVNQDAGGNVIMEIQPKFDGFDRKRSYEVTLRDVQGATEPTWGLFSFYEQCYATIYIDGSLVMSNGLITGSRQEDMGNAVPYQSRPSATNPGTTVTLTCVDGWFILDEFELTTDPILDRLNLADATIVILKTVGYQPSDYANITPGTGPVLPAAVPGEKPAIRNAIRAKAGQWLRDLYQRYGQGTCLYQNSYGVWGVAGLATPSGTLATYAGQPAVYQAVPSLNNSDTASGRLAILNKLNMVRDISEFYNSFYQEGATNPLTGAALTAVYTDQASAYGPMNQPNVVNWLGRIRLYHSERDEALRTQGQVNAVCRSLKTFYFRGCLFFEILTYFQPACQPRDLIYICPGGSTPETAWAAEIVSLNRASAFEDIMEFRARVLGLGAIS